MTYWSELKAKFRYLLAASLGLSFGYMVNMYVTSIFSPHLISEFGWTRSQFALLGITILIGTVAMPIAGRLTDIFGVRGMATVGVILTPLTYVAFSMVGDDFSVFVAITIFQVAFVGTTTTSAVYTRLIAERFDLARGLALSVAASLPAATAAITAPLLTSFIDAHGWRAGYLALAAVCAVGGAIALLLIARAPPEAAVPRRASANQTAKDYRLILRSRAFQVIVVGILMCNLTHTVVGSQLKLILLDHGIASDSASAMVSLFAIGIMAGRLLSGLALDRYPSHIVASVVLGLPGLGLFMLAAGPASMTMTGTAVLVIGLSTGAELDVVAYLVMRFFPVEIYGTAYGMIAAAIAISSASGALILSCVLELTGSFKPFLLVTSATTLFGSGLFLLLRAGKPRAAAPPA